MSKQFTFEAIGTHFWIEIFDEIADTELEATKSRLELLSLEFDKQYSRFRTDSLISSLNYDRTIADPTEELRELLMLGKRFYTDTEGVFNLLTGHILEAQGYDAAYSLKPTKEVEAFSRCNPLTDMSVLEHTITLACGSVDVGGFAKGYLIDKMAADLISNNIKYFLINGGGDMCATSNLGEPIEIYLEHPTEVGKYLAKTTLLNQGFAASSPFKRQWKHGEGVYSHIVSEGKSPEFASFVKAPTATIADAFATASLLLSEEQLLVITARDGVAIARFNPHTSELWQTANFT